MTTATSTPPPSEAATITQHEMQQVEHANETGKQPVVFIHGLWLLPSSWDRWAAVFEEAGYTALTPGWPDDPETVAEANAAPRSFRAQDRRPGRRPFRRDHSRTEQEACHHRPFIRRPARADPRRAWAVCGHGRH